MDSYELSNTDSEDIEDLLVKVETSFNIRFKTEDFTNVKTFGALCDLITDKIQLEHSESCTTQQAFYKLREAIVTSLRINHDKITPDLKLEAVFPKENRRTAVKRLENQLDLKLKLLRAPFWITSALVILLLLSLIGIFFNWQMGLSGLAFAILGLKISDYFGTVLDLQTIGQLTEKMTREHYIQSRRNPTTFNKNEIEKILIDWFSEDLLLDKSKLTRDSEWI